MKVPSQLGKIVYPGPRSKLSLDAGMLGKPQMVEQTSRDLCSICGGRTFDKELCHNRIPHQKFNILLIITYTNYALKRVFGSSWGLPARQGGLLA